MAVNHQSLEVDIRRACDQADFNAATTLAIEGYGPEVLGFLVARLRSESEARDVFSDFAEDFWKGISGFEWRCSARAWAYTLARHAAVRYATSPARRPARNIPLSQVHGIGHLAERVRTSTLIHLRTEMKNKVRSLRERLPADEQALLVLRVDKGLPWRELALVLSDEASPLADADLDREAARLRKRFQLIKNKLKKIAREEGLIG